MDGVPSKLLGGISQTLYNLFDGYPSNKLYAICDKNQINEITDSSLKTRVVKVTYASIKFKRRPFNYFNRLLTYLDLSYREFFIHHYISKKQIPVSGIIFLCTSNIEKIQLAKKIKQSGEYTLITYYMDDWMSDYQYKWLNGSLQDYIKWSLDAAKGYIMISEQLLEVIKLRYSIKDNPTLILHNPVEIIASKPNIRTTDTSIPFKIAYAGSIWPMHKDAIIKCIEAINLINSNNKNSIILNIYCKEIFWNSNENELNRSFIKYGGFIEYDNLYDELQSNDLLLVASSFLEENRSYSISSIQTKITDYLNFKIPILSIGPSFSASNKFIEKYQCGFVWNDEMNIALDEYLINIMQDPLQREKYTQNGMEVLKAHFDKKNVQLKLYQFLNNLSKNIK